MRTSKGSSFGACQSTAVSHGSRPRESATGVDHCHVLLGGTERFLVDRGEGFEGTATEAVGTWQLGWLSRRGASLCLVRGAYLTLSVWF